MSDSSQPPDDFASAFDAAAERLRAAVAVACARPGPWAARVAAAIDAALRFAAADPAAARLLLVEPWAHGAAGMARRGLLLGGFAAQLAAGREETPGTAEPFGLAEQMLVASLAALIAKRLHGEPGAAELPALAPELTEFVLLHYLDPARARLWARRSRLGPERPADVGESDAVRRATFAEVLGLLQGMIGAEVGVVVNLLDRFFDCGFHARLERVETLASGDGPVLVVFAGAQGIALDPAEVESFLGRLPGSEWIELHVGGSLRLVIEALSEPGAD